MGSVVRRRPMNCGGSEVKLGLSPPRQHEDAANSGDLLTVNGWDADLVGRREVVPSLLGRRRNLIGEPRQHD
jgi:hypothetical protein